ncbi:MAG: tetraacyldisaccharide 4'-kinase [Proteobacteria bacterium]|nr:tetraacyldisaccharide 4'-kinase [Pseudomonadota bacterium]
MPHGFKHKIETLIRDDGPKGPSLFDALLRGLSKCYVQGVKIGNQLYERKLIHPRNLPCPVISIGNITVGGTGKTPMTIYLARECQKKGFRPLILSRGYKGSASGRGGMVSDGKEVFMGCREAGDEPYMMAHLLPGVPVFVGKDRYETGLKAIKAFSPDLILLDDGFQHRTLYRDLDILLFDASKPFGNGFLLPRGPMREPVAGIGRGHVFVLTRSRGVLDPVGHFKTCLRNMDVSDDILCKPVITSLHSPQLRCVIQAGTGHVLPWNSRTMSPGSVFAFSGIADNGGFRESLVHLGFHVEDYMAFSDHHPYNQEDLDAVAKKAADSGVSVIVTTEKDFSRIQKMIRFPLDLLVMGIDIAFDQKEDDLLDLVFSRVRQNTL